MYELSRIRLHSVGPKGARYQDVTLDLRDVGAPVARPVQEALVAFDTARRVRRPSPASVLFLENGGGKSVLIKLIFSVMLPGRRQVVGTTNTRVLEKFVLAGDVAHVALEWQHVKTGQRVVVGKVSAWRDHVVSTDPKRLIEAWYSFRPTAAFNLDTLPFTENGRLVSLAGFRDRLGDAHKAEPEIEAAWETGHDLWTDKLGALGLDPELFAYQRRMNAGEGEAAEAFAFRSDEAFIDWLLTAVTKEEDVRTLGEVVESYATKLAQRDGLAAERDFVAGALDLLTPLAAAAADAAAAHAIQRDVRREAERFAASLRARHAAEEERLDKLTEQAGRAAIDDKATDRERRRLNEVMLELQRLVAGLRYQAAEAEKGRLSGELDKARETLAAWQATEVLLQHAVAREKADRIRRIVDEQEEQAAPVLAARDEAARRLARALLATAAAADTEASALDEQVLALDKEIDRAEEDRQDATRRAERERGNAEAADNKIGEAEEAIAAAVRGGLLASTDQDVAAAAKAARNEAAAAKARLDAAESRLDTLAERRKKASNELKAARQNRDGLAKAAADAHRSYTDAAGASVALADEERLAALLGTGEVRLDTDAPTLLDLLAVAVRDAEDEQTRLRIDERHDQRVLDALGTGGLLPPNPDVTAALAALEAAGITAWSGWQYLAKVLPVERDRVLTAYPHLVDGVVLNNRDHLDRARQVLADAELLPRSVVAVGTTADLADLTVPPPSGLGFVVPPNPAMYDEERAERERKAIIGRQDVRSARLTSLGRQIESDQRLRRRLEDWRRDYPPGTLDRLRDADEKAAAALREIESRIEAISAQIDQIEAAEDETRRAVPDLRAAAEKATSDAERLDALAGQVARIPELREASRNARDAARAHDEDAVAHRARATALRKTKEEAVRKADDQRRIVRACRDELSRVPGGGSVDLDDPVPTDALDTLRGAYETAKDAAAKVEVGVDLRAELGQVEQAEAQTRTAVENLKSTVRALAADLLATPDGADAAGRAAATSRAERTVHDLETRLREQVEKVGELKNDYENRPAQDVTLEPYGKPRDIAHGEELAARAEADWNLARTRYEEAHTRRERLERQVGEGRQTVNGFGAHLDALAGIVPAEVDADVTAFAGTVDDARARRDEVMRQLRDAENILEEAERKVRVRADALAGYATEDRFKDVSSPVRRQIAAVGRDTLPDYAADWQQALRPRLRSLNDDLAQIDRHRATIIARLRGMVDQALGTLRSAQRLSKLPDDLGDWSGQEFLRIRFTDPDRAALDDRLGEVIDEATAATRTSDRSGGKRDGLTLLLKGVRAAMQPKGVKVEMLKPDAVLRTERLRVAEIGDVFSGGQLLTAAIILYCTMAALRANERGHTRRPHAGVLFLDNPIGRASAGYLLELQLKVADTLGVQLIYTTGLFDTNALSVFPLVIRLRNDADLRAGLKYLNVEETIRRALDDLPDPDDTATVTATRVFTHPDTPDTQTS